MSSEVPEQPPLMGILRIPAQFGNEERTFPVVLGSNIIGKNKGSIMLNDDFVSSLHANIHVLGEGEHWIEDVGSTNGTYFGDAIIAIRPKRFYQLSDGKILRFGRTIAVYKFFEKLGGCDGAAAAAGNEEGFGNDLRKDSKENVYNETANFIDNEIAIAAGDHVEQYVSEKTTQESSNRTGIVLVQDTQEQAIDHATLQEDDIKEIESAGDVNIEEDDIVADKSNIKDNKNDETQPVAPPKGVAGKNKSPRFPSVIAQQQNQPTEEIIVEGSSVPLKIMEKHDDSVVVLVEETSSKSAPRKSPILSKKSNSLTERFEAEAKEEITVESGETHSRESPIDLKARDNVDKKPTKAKGRGRKRNSVASSANEPATKRRNACDRIIDENSNSLNNVTPEMELHNVSHIEKDTLKNVEIKIILTSCELTAAKKKKIEDLGIQVAKNWLSATHLVSTAIKRTSKFLCCLTSGKTLTTMDWIDACIKEKSVLDAKDFPLTDPEAEKKYDFVLEQSLERLQERGASKLMAGLKFHITPSTIPDYQDLKEMIEASGGDVLANLPLRNDPNVRIIGCRDDKELLSQYSKLGWKEQIFETEYIMSGLLRQKLEEQDHFYYKSALTSSPVTSSKTSKTNIAASNTTGKATKARGRAKRSRK